MTNVYGSVPLNKEGSDLTAYPDVFLYSTFNDGSIGLSNTELPTDHRQTLDRRGLIFSSNDAIKTITIQVSSTTTLIGSITDGTFQNLIGTLYFVKSRSDVGSPTSVGSIRSLSYAVVNKPLINPSIAVKFLELTVVGSKDELELLLLEYDNGDDEYLRRLYLSEAGAQGDDPNTAFGHIVDYRQTITPVIGKAKPKQFLSSKTRIWF